MQHIAGKAKYEKRRQVSRAHNAALQYLDEWAQRSRNR
jgi:hypothetical protein